MSFKVYFDHNVVAGSPSARPLPIVEQVLRAGKRVQIILSDAHLFETHGDCDANGGEQLHDGRADRRCATAKKYLRFATECDVVWRQSWLEPLRMLFARQEQLDPGSISAGAMVALSEAASASIQNGLRSIANAPCDIDAELNAVVRNHKAASLLAEVLFCSGRYVRDSLTAARRMQLVPQPGAHAAFMNPGREITLERAHGEWNRIMRDRADVAEAQRLVSENADELLTAYGRDMLAHHLGKLCDTLDANNIPLSRVVTRVVTRLRRYGGARFLRAPVSDVEVLETIQRWIWATPQTELPMPVLFAMSVTLERVLMNTRPRGGGKPIDSNVLDALHASCGFDADLFVVDDGSFAEAMISARNRLHLTKPEVLTARQADGYLLSLAELKANAC